MKQITYSNALIIKVLEHWIDINMGCLPAEGLNEFTGSTGRKNPMEGWLVAYADINEAISQLAKDENVTDRWVDICQLSPEGTRMRCPELTPVQQRVVRVYIFSEIYRGYWKDDCDGIIGRMRIYLNHEEERPNSYKHRASVQQGRKIIGKAINEVKNERGDS